MVSLFKWFGKQQPKRNFFNTDLLISKEGKTPIESPEIMRVINKFASIFMDAEIWVEDESGTIHKHKTDALNKLLSTDPMNRGKASFLNQFCKISFTQGGAVIKKTIINNEIKALDLLNPLYINPQINTNVNRLQIMNFTEFFTRLDYNDFFTGNTIQLNMDEISIFVDNPSPDNAMNFKSRLYEIQDKINNSYYANNMLSSLLNRCAIVFLTRDNKEEFTTIVTTGEAKQRTKNFNDAYHINNAAIVPIGDNMRALNTTVNVKATGVFDSFGDTIAAACNMLGITKVIMDIEGATFSNQSGAIKDAIQNGIQSFADKTADFLTEMLKQNDMLTNKQHVVFDYTQVLQRNLATSPDEITPNQGTPQADPIEPETDTAREANTTEINTTVNAN